MALFGCQSGHGGAPPPPPPPQEPAAISANPADLTVDEGQPATFSVTATGTPPLAYQWMDSSGAAIPSETGATFTLPAARYRDSGRRYSVQVSNSFGSVASAAAILTVRPRPYRLGATPASIAPGEQVALVALHPDDGGAYLVAPGAIPAPSGEPIQVSPVASTSYVLSAPAGDGRVNVAAATVEVTGSPLPAFTAAGPLAQGRLGASATLLADGRVLVAGGIVYAPFGAPGPATASAEIFDPATLACRAAGDMGGGRAYHSATLLGSGKVLLAGGERGGSSLSEALLFDPIAEAFAAVPGGMAVPRSHHRATLLADGRVLVTGGVYGGQTLAGAELYDPATNRFTSATGSMLDSRSDHEAALLASGEVLVAGGRTTDVSPRTVLIGGSPTDPLRELVVQAGEIFDPVTGRFTAVAAPMRDPRFDFASARLDDGRILFWGSTRTLEAYDPAVQAFGRLLFQAASGALGRELRAASLARLADGRVLLSGGESFGLDQWYTQGPVAYLFDPGPATLVEAGQLIVPRHGHRAILLPSGRVLVVGGATAVHSGIHGKAELASPVVELFDPAHAPHLRVAVSPSSSAVYAGTPVALAATVSGTPLASAVAWSLAPPAGATLSPTGDTTAVFTDSGLAGTWIATATSAIDPGGQGQATVTVYVYGNITVAIAPDPAVVPPNGSQHFTATLTNAVNTGVTWSVVEANGGVISAAGDYLAPSAPGTYHVRAVSVDDPTKSATAAVQVQ